MEEKIKMSEFTQATEAKDTDEIIILQDGINKRLKSPIFEQKVIDKVGDGFLSLVDGKIPNENLTFGEVKKGDLNVVSGEKVYYNIPKLETNSILDKSYIKNNTAIRTNGGILEGGWIIGGHSIVDFPLSINSTFTLHLDNPSAEKVMFLVNDNGDVDLNSKKLLSSKKTTFKTNSSYHKLRAYVKLIDSQENDSNWENYVYITKESEDVFLEGINGAKIPNKINSIEYIKSLEVFDFIDFIKNNIAISSKGELINGSGYKSAIYIPIVFDFKRVKFEKLSVSIGQSKFISQYDSNKNHIKTNAQSSGSFDLLLDSNCSYISFTLQSPNDSSNNVSLLLNTKKSSIKTINGIYINRSDVFKKGISLGDSKTWYDLKKYLGSNKFKGQTCFGYQTYVRDYFNCIYDNAGESGWDITQIINKVKTINYTDYDFATLTSMANDARKGVPLGELKDVGDSFDTSTYIGAFQSSIEFILNSNPSIKLILMTSIKGWFNENGTSDVPSLYNTDIPLSYVNALKEIASLYSLPIVDLYNESGINKINRPIYIGDNEDSPYFLHPNNLGYERIASIIISKMIELTRNE